MKKTIVKNSLDLKLSTKAIIGVSAGIAAAVILMLLASSGMPYFASNLPPPPPLGLCVTRNERTADHISRDSCQKKSWLLYCPDISPTQPATDCNCGVANAEKSATTTRAISNRSNYIEAWNDGNISVADSKDMAIFNDVADLDCTCHIYSAGNKPIGDGAERKLVTIDSIDSKGHQIKGVHTFVRKAAILFSKTKSDWPNCQQKITTGVSAECFLSNSYEGDDERRNPDSYVPLDKWNESPQDPHETGRAADIVCLHNPKTATGCTGGGANVFGLVSGNSSGLNIIKECTIDEGRCANSSVGDQLIHIDEVARSSNDPNSPGGSACLFQNCVWDCAPIPR